MTPKLRSQIKTQFFQGFRGSLMGGLLQLPALRAYRVSQGFMYLPDTYEAFTRDVLIPRMRAYIDKRFGIFCASEHTKSLLKTCDTQCNFINCIMDNNVKLQGAKFEGLRVVSPEEGVSECEVIFVSSTLHQHQIKSQLRSLGFHGKILLPDDDVPPEWFSELIIE